MRTRAFGGGQRAASKSATIQSMRCALALLPAHKERQFMSQNPRMNQKKLKQIFSKTAAIFVDLGPKMAKYGRWRPDTGVTRQPIAVLCSLVTMAAMYGHWLTHLRRICDIPSRRLLSAVLYGETPLGADRAEEVRLTAKRKP